MKQKDINKFNKYRRLLLIEFVQNERWVFNSRFFPFVNGEAQRLGMETKWLCFGAPLKLKKTSYSEGFLYADINNQEKELVKKIVTEFKPSHIMISHTVSEDVASILQLKENAAPVISMSDQEVGFGLTGIWSYLSSFYDKFSNNFYTDLKLPKIFYLSQNSWSWHVNLTNWVLNWFGEKQETNQNFNKYIVDDFIPKYDAKMANKNAKNFKPHIIIFGGLSCDHLKPLKSNKYYVDLDLSQCQHDFGCAFCTWYRGPTSEISIDLFETAKKQLSQIFKTSNKNGRNCNEFEIYDIRLFKKIDEFAAMVAKLNIPASKFYFEPRADRVVQVAERLDNALKIFSDSGHVISLLRMGAETLIESENAMYNKDITLKQLDEASLKLKQLKQKYPDNFEYDPTWGYITCSPWTTLEVFEQMVNNAIERNFDPLDIWLYTPLLLYKSSPITLMAQKQGDIIQNHVDDLSLLYEPSVNDVSFNSFYSWKFKDKRMSHAFALIVRFCAKALKHKYSDPIFDGDSLYHELINNKLLHEKFTRPDLFAKEVIAVTKQSSSPYDRKKILELAIKRYIAIYDKLKPISHKSRQIVDNIDKETIKKAKIIIFKISKRFNEKTNQSIVIQNIDFINKSKLKLDLSVDNSSYALFLSEKNSTPRFVFSTNNLAVTHAKETPMKNKKHQKKLLLFCQILDKILLKHIPDLLTP